MNGCRTRWCNTVEYCCVAHCPSRSLPGSTSVSSPLDPPFVRKKTKGKGLWLMRPRALLCSLSYYRGCNSCEVSQICRICSVVSTSTVVRPETRSNRCILAAEGRSDTRLDTIGDERIEQKRHNRHIGTSRSDPSEKRSCCRRGGANPPDDHILDECTASLLAEYHPPTPALVVCSPFMNRTHSSISGVFCVNCSLKTRAW